MKNLIALIAALMAVSCQQQVRPPCDLPALFSDCPHRVTDVRSARALLERTVCLPGYQVEDRSDSPEDVTFMCVSDNHRYLAGTYTDEGGLQYSTPDGTLVVCHAEDLKVHQLIPLMVTADGKPAHMVDCNECLLLSCPIPE